MSTDATTQPPTTKRCSKCGFDLPLERFHRRSHYVRSGHRSACAECTSETSRARPRRSRTAEEARKELVRARTRRAIEQGLLVPSPCRFCGDVAVEPHHPDYERRNAHLFVEWLCKPHHARVHGKLSWTKQLDLFPRASRTYVVRT